MLSRPDLSDYVRSNQLNFLTLSCDDYMESSSSLLYSSWMKRSASSILILMVCSLSLPKIACSSVRTFTCFAYSVT